MIDLREVHPLTDFLRNHKEHVERLKSSGVPEVLTINGKAALIVQDVESYQALVRCAEQSSFVSAVREGIADWKAGRVVDAEEAVEEIKRELEL